MPPTFVTDDHQTTPLALDAGQSTVEYALVILAAALIALLLIAWATGGGGAGRIGSLVDHVFDLIDSRLG